MAAKTSTADEGGVLSSFGTARSTVRGTPLSDDQLQKTHAFWRVWDKQLHLQYLDVESAIEHCTAVQAREHRGGQ